MYCVYGEESGEVGTYKTLDEAKKAIEEVKRFDMEELGYTDNFFVEEEED